MSETAVEPLGQRPDPVEEARDAIIEPSLDVYHNPLEKSSRMALNARAYAYRAGASFAFGVGNMMSPSVPPPHTTVYLDSTFSKEYSGKDKIRADVWTPDRPGTLSRKSSRSSLRSVTSKSGRRQRKEEKKLAKQQRQNEALSGPEDDSALEAVRTLSREPSYTDEEDLTASTSKLNISGPNTGKKRPSTISRISSRLSTRSSKEKVKSGSSVSLTPTPSSSSAGGPNPMDQIPTTLIPQADPNARRPAVINFHGGGFVLGQGTDDGRWAMAVMQALGAVVFSVEYRLAPSYPFPTPVEDCADAILQIWRRADEFWIDPEKIILSGFSAGGTLALASWVLLNDYKRWGYNVDPPKPDSKTTQDRTPEVSISDENGDENITQDPNDPNIPHAAGLMLFYPLLDWTESRPRKRLTCARPDLTLPRSLTDVFDASYIYPPEVLKSQLDNPLLSPGLMPDDLVDRLPPVQLCLCEHDMLLAEGERFAARLRERNKQVGYRVVLQAKHAWDKPLPFNPPESLGVEYGEAVRVLARWLGREEDNGSGEDLGVQESGQNGGTNGAADNEGEREVVPPPKQWLGKAETEALKKEMESGEKSE